MKISVIGSNVVERLKLIQTQCLSHLRMSRLVFQIIAGFALGSAILLLLMGAFVVLRFPPHSPWEVIPGFAVIGLLASISLRSFFRTTTTESARASAARGATAYAFGSIGNEANTARLRRRPVFQRMRRMTRKLYSGKISAGNLARTTDYCSLTSIVWSLARWNFAVEYDGALISACGLFDMAHCSLGLLIQFRSILWFWLTSWRTTTA